MQEIRSYENPARIADAPSFIKGVVNLRGVIVPIVDLRLKLGCDSARVRTASPLVIVLNVEGRVAERRRRLGLRLCSNSPRTPSMAAPEVGSSMDTSFISGIGTVQTDAGERMLILLDIEGLHGPARRWGSSPNSIDQGSPHAPHSQKGRHLGMDLTKMKVATKLSASFGLLLTMALLLGGMALVVRWRS